MAKRSTRTRKANIPEDMQIADKLLPKGAARLGLFYAVDIINFTDGDQRAMVRATGYAKTDKEKDPQRRTIKRKSRFGALGLTQRGIDACEWFANVHALRYDTQGGTTARYGEGVKSGKTSFDHLPTTPEQEGALADFTYARAGISPSLIGLFENVVLYGGEIGNRKLAFAVAVEQLVERIEGRVNL